GGIRRQDRDEGDRARDELRTALRARLPLHQCPPRPGGPCEGNQLMRQILMNSGGAVVARMPRPALEPGSVLVRVHYSLISVGTEIAPLKNSLSHAGSEASTAVDKSVAYAHLATHYLRASWRDPRKAARRLASIAR